jgi:RNA polymerase sigma factor (TIGR02999 family)
LVVNHITQLLDAASHGSGAAAEQLLPLVYDELRKLAAARMSHEKPGQTLQPTALVHEAWMRLTDENGSVRFENRAHFFGAAAEAMRRILVENARRKKRAKHGGALQRVDWTNLDVAVAEDDDAVLAVSEALDKLAQHDSVGAELIKLRFFAGLPNVEAAKVLGLSERTAKRTWAYARAWLLDELRKNQ